MKNITLSADERLIEAARERARSEHTTLNEQFRRWLADYTPGPAAHAALWRGVAQLRGQLQVGGQAEPGRDE